MALYRRVLRVGRDVDEGATQMIRQAYLDAAESGALLLADPAVAAAWHEPSALTGFTVRGLAGHLARQITHVPRFLAHEVPDAEPIALLEHYGRAQWLGTDLDSESNAGIREDGEQEAAIGAAALAAQVRAAAERLRNELPAQPRNRTIYLPWGPWSLSLDDFLITRMMEIAVHGDDLAVSVGLRTPPLPADVLDPVLALLTQLAVRRHGSTAVLRALSRSERAPATIAGI